MPQPDPIRILFVCLGNICRSPSGENVLRHLVEAEELSEHFHIDSAGTIDYHSGHSPDTRMTAAALKRGIAVAGRARQATPDDFREFDLIVAMDRSNYDDLLALRDQCSEPTARLAMFCDFCENHDESDVPDPYYGGAAGFEKVLDLLEDGCGAIVRRWQRGEL
ncbi:MAG: low molecular weight protein-tyrosine-phosphatase [Verrucomicrobiales bacterium]